MTTFAGEVDLDDSSDRLASADDVAARREAQFLRCALLAHSARSAGQMDHPGSCTNCGAPCLPAAVYCDEYCRADHETRTRRLARQGRTC